MDEVKIISLQKRGNKISAKAGASFYAKAPRSKYSLFLTEQLGKISGEDQENFCSIVSKRLNKIKEDPARVIAYNSRAKQIRDE